MVYGPLYRDDSAVTEETTVNIFLPTTPNPTSGFLLFIPREDVIPLDMSVEEAVKMVISGGSLQGKTSIEIFREKEKTPVLGLGVSAL